MRKITIDDRNVPMLESEVGERVRLGEFIGKEIIAQGRNVTNVQARAGITHPQLVKCVRGINDSPKPMISALDELGYDIVLVRRLP